MENYRHNIAVNLTQLRKKKGLTQSQLAKELHYIDKAISKWENEYTVPSLETVIEIAKFYGVTVDYIISDHTGTEPQVKEVERKYQLNSRNKFIISFMSCLGVWFLACVLYTLSMIFFNVEYDWMIFIWAVPACFIAMVVFNEIWGRRKARVYLISGLMWTLFTAVFVHLIMYNINLWMLFIIAIPIQIGFILWDRMKENNIRK